MRIIFKHLAYVFCILVFLGCENKLEIIDSYPFQISVTGTKEALLTETLVNELVITPENSADNTSFSFSYNANGKGYYKIDNSKIEENKFYNLPLNVLSISLKFVPLEEGEIQVDFFVTDNKEHSSSNTTTYIVNTELTDFEFSFVPGDEEIFVGELSSINFSIEQNTDEVLTYSVTINSKSDGEIYWGEKQNLPYTIENIQQGNYSLDYIAAEVIDKNIFTITIIASNGIAKTESFKGIEVLPVKFDFILSKNKITVSENQVNTFIAITLNRPTNLVYQPQYFLVVTTTTEGILFDNGNTSFGTNISLGDFTGITNETFSYSLLFTDTVIGGEITFTVFNNTGFEINKAVNVEIIE